MTIQKANSILALENLEPRLMMTGDIDFSNGVISIVGAEFDDFAVVEFAGNRVYIDLEADEADGGMDHSDIDRAISNVSQINFEGFDGNDSILVLISDLNDGVSLDQISLLFNGGEGNDIAVHSSSAVGIPMTATGGAGDDQFVGGPKDDWFYGEDGDDGLAGGAGIDMISGGLGDDMILGGEGNDNLFGNEDEDFLQGEEGFNLLYGGTEDDIYSFWQGPAGVPSTDWISDSGGRDSLNFGAMPAGIQLDLAVTAQQTILIGVLNLRIDGSIEDVYGSNQDDIIRGNSAANTLYGEVGHDVLEGRGGDDLLIGGSGKDRYVFAGSSLGTDEIIEIANVDVDTLDFSGMPSGLTIDIRKFGDNLAVNSTALKVKLSGATSIENVIGTAYNDNIYGNTRNNKLSGQGGRDMIRGFDGKDILDGGAGNDYLYGGTGDDQLIVDGLDLAWGELGRDWFGSYREISGAANPNTNVFMDWGTL